MNSPSPPLPNVAGPSLRLVAVRRCRYAAMGRRIVGVLLFLAPLAASAHSHGPCPTRPRPRPLTRMGLAPRLPAHERRPAGPPPSSARDSKFIFRSQPTQPASHGLKSPFNLPSTEPAWSTVHLWPHLSRTVKDILENILLKNSKILFLCPEIQLILQNLYLSIHSPINPILVLVNP